MSDGATDGATEGATEGATDAVRVLFTAAQPHEFSP